jgi:hypothetical protein
MQSELAFISSCTIETTPEKNKHKLDDMYLHGRRTSSGKLEGGAKTFRYVSRAGTVKFHAAIL